MNTFWNLWLIETISIIKRPLIWFCIGMLSVILISDLVGAYVSADTQNLTSSSQSIVGSFGDANIPPEVIRQAQGLAVEKSAWPAAFIRSLDLLRQYDWLIVLIKISSTMAQEYIYRNPQLLLSRGISRRALIGSKMAAHLVSVILIVLAPMFMASIVSGAFTQRFLGTLNLQLTNFYQLAISLLLTIYSLLPYASLALCLTVASRYFILPLGGGIGFIILENFLFRNGAGLSRYLPYMLGIRLTEIYQEIAATELIGSYAKVAPDLPVALLPFSQAVIGIALWTAFFLAVSFWLFQRQALPE